ncbi:unnamed protein product [Dicrocoelium dendriticum]|nr:unnamed protein product [Dicrocoelium dendriticum]
MSLPFYVEPGIYITHCFWSHPTSIHRITLKRKRQQRGIHQPHIGGSVCGLQQCGKPTIAETTKTSSRFLQEATAFPSRRPTVYFIPILGDDALQANELTESVATHEVKQVHLYGLMTSNKDTVGRFIDERNYYTFRTFCYNFRHARRSIFTAFCFN